MITIEKFYLYVCSYDDRYFMDIVAVDEVQARAIFEECLYASYKVEAAHSKTVINREVRTRNIYGYSG